MKYSIFKDFFSILTKHEKIQFLFSIVLVIFNGIFELFTVGLIAFFARVLIDPNYGREKLSFFISINVLTDHFIILYFSLVVGIAYFFKNAFGVFDIFHQSRMIRNISLRVKKQILENISSMKYELFTTKNSTDYVSIVQSEVESFFSSGMIQSLMFISEVFVFFFLVSFVIYLNPKAFFFILPLILISAFFLKKIVLPFFENLGRTQSQYGILSNKSIYQFFHSFKEILLFQKVSFCVDDFLKKNEHFQKNYYRQQASTQVPRFFLEVFFVFIFVCSVAIINGTASDLKHSVSVISSYLYLGFRLMPSLNRMIGALGNVRSSLPRLQNFLPYYFFQKQNANAILKNPKFIFSDNINFQNVSFSYPQSDECAVKDLSYQFSKNKCIGVVGKTGSGKSTLVDLFLGLLTPSQGSILIDGEFLPQTQEWHQKVGYVPQSIYLIDGTIEENIAFFEYENIDEKALHFAIHAAQLGALIAKLPQGVQTVVGERGVRLSGGERQRIAIARALYRNPEVLVFDEATSALDNETEEKLMDTIYEVSQKRTVIMIAHRLTTLKRCDEILMLEHGELKRITKYEDLIRKNQNFVIAKIPLSFSEI